jgi:hypothetical protein
MNLAGLSIALGIALIVYLALPYSLVVVVPLAIWWVAKKKQ